VLQPVEGNNSVGFEKLLREVQEPISSWPWVDAQACYSVMVVTIPRALASGHRFAVEETWYAVLGKTVRLDQTLEQRRLASGFGMVTRAGPEETRYGVLRASPRKGG
jgi:hypothetical protein